MNSLNWIALAIGAPASLALAAAVRTVARCRGWLESPGPERLHARPVPRLGGLAMYAAFVLTVVVAVRPIGSAVVGLLVGGTLLVVVMTWDDMRGLRPRDKFLAQLLAAAVPLAVGVRIDAVSDPLAGGVIALPIAIVIPVTLFWIVGMMNAVNFMDGLDGLGGGVTAIAGAVLVILSVRLGLPDVATLALVLVAVTLGFLPLNFYRSSINMGDAGSHFLGFSLAVIAIMGPAKIATAILVLGVPILDVAWSITRRLALRGGIADRDAGHLHHRLWEAGLNQPMVALLYYALTAGLGLIALLVERINKVYAFAGLAALLIVLLAVLARLPRRRVVSPPSDCQLADDA